MNLSDYTQGGGSSGGSPSTASSASSRVNFGNNGSTVTPEAALVAGGLGLVGLLLVVLLIKH